MRSLLGDSSAFRQPPPTTRFAQSPPVFASCRGSRPLRCLAGTAPAIGTSRLGSPTGPFFWPLGLTALTAPRAATTRAEDSVNGMGDGVDGGHPVHRLVQALGCIVIGDRRGLRPIGGEPAFEH